ATRLARIRNGTGPANVRLPVAPTEWVIYRFAMTETETRVFVNENPVPVIVFTPASGANRHFRIGDGDSGANFGSDIDWIIWDITGSHAPGEGTAVPFAELTPQWDIRLSDLQVGGTTVAGFHPAVVNYEVILSPDAVNPPLVAANAQLTSSSVVITQATAIPGTATIAVTSEDGLTTRTYSVHFRKRSSNANLATLTVGGTPLAGFSPEVITYDIALPVGTTAAPAIAATVAEWSSILAITQATAVPGTGTVLVTSEDGTTRTYTLNFRHVSTNANLADLMVGGTAIAGFSPTVTTYEVALPPATTVAPTVTATAADARATVVITQAAAIPGAATVRVTAEDGTTSVTYTINFRLQSTNANLANLMVGGTAIAGFSPTVTTYEVALPPATTVAPTVTATAADARATVVITQAAAIPGAATVRVTAEDGTTVVTYTINFRLQSTNANLANLMVGGTAIAGFNPEVTSYNVVLAAGTTVAPTVSAVLADTRAGMIITQAPTVPGRATVAVTAEAGNQRTYEVNFSTDPTGVEIPLERLFRVFPNPATTFLNLEWAGQEKADLEIISATGKVMLRKTVESYNVNIDIGHLVPGIYIIQLTSGQQQARQLFIKSEH
ncbi:MAG TPA: T9SS type A sorting domain-containing protein, partial [Bacteroidales bacterium]|nr:T9SS type A sorting domain-containing protein [Bacteroidales bacterium]